MEEVDNVLLQLVTLLKLTKFTVNFRSMQNHEFLGYDSTASDERPGDTGAQGHLSRSRPQLLIINPILRMLNTDIFLRYASIYIIHKIMQIPTAQGSIGQFNLVHLCNNACTFVKKHYPRNHSSHCFIVLISPKSFYDSLTLDNKSIELAIRYI